MVPSPVKRRLKQPYGLGFGFRVKGLGFGVRGLGFRVGFGGVEFRY